MVCQNNNKLTKHLLTLSTKQTNNSSNTNSNNNQPSRLRIGRSHLNSHSRLNSRGWGYYKSLIPTLTKLALPSLIILSTIISLCTPILSTTIPSVNAVTNNTNQTATSTNNTTTNTSSNGSSTTNLDPSDPNYLNTVLEANGIDTSNTASNQANGSNGITTNDVDPTTMASDLASLNNALEAQAANEGISLSLSSNNQPVSTTNPATINIDPSTATGSGVTTNSILAATSITANVKTAMPGYSLTIQQAANTTTTNNTNIANPNGSLINPANPSNSPILSTDGTPDSPKALGNNEWGYAISGSNNFDTSYTTGNTNPLTSKWAKVPTNQEDPQTIKSTEDTPQATGDNTTVYYAANVPKTKIAGNYQTTITYTANVLAPPEVKKVSPDTIRQGMSMIMGDAPTDTSGESGARANYTCYLTNAGSVYCAIGGTGGFDVAMFMSAVAPYGQYEVISAGNGYSWYRIKTDGIEGTVTQIYTNSVQASMYNRYPFTYTCYLTNSGGVYCALWLQYGDVPNAMSFLAPYYQYEVVPANDSYGWCKIETDAMNGGSATSGTTITLTGKNLSKVTNVYIDTNNNSALDEGTDIAVSNLKITSDTQLTFTAPSMSPGTYNLIITNPGNVVVEGTLTYR